MRDDLEWEDIETMLYNQVNHGRAENEESIIATCKHSEAKTQMNTRHMKQKRYFTAERGISNSPFYFSFENEGKVGSDNITMQNNLIISPNNPITHGNNFTPYYKNTITVNQYTTIPFIVNSDQHGTHIPRPNNQSCVSLSTKKNKSLKKRRKQMIARRNRGKRREKINGNPQSNFSFSSLLVEASVKGTFQRNANEVICVSDESSTECIILHDMEPLAPSLNKNVSTDFSDNYNRCNGDINKLGIDEDIIFIPPPPVEVINIDVEERREISQEANIVQCIVNEPNSSETNRVDRSPSCNKNNDSPLEYQNLSCSPESSASNDFLENTNVENTPNNFNFGLHGSDFNNVDGDFVKPAKPVDNDCETESSCSTNELNRTFNNTVKTIVFDEVDFPKEDIFSEKNLESFGSYITPNRNTKRRSQNDLKNINKSDLCISSDSSSESDMEPCQSNKKLPILSPMQCGTMDKRESKNKITKVSSKSKSADIFEISSSDSSTEGPAVVKEKQAKKKHKKKKTNSTETVKDKSLIRKKAGFGTATSEVVESNSTLSTSQKKKKKSLISRHEEVSNDIKNVSDVMVKPKKKKKSYSGDSLQNSELEESGKDETFDKPKKNKSFSTDNSENENNFIQKRSKKRKKSSLTSSNKAIALGEEYIEVDLTEQVNVTENNICEIIAGSCDSQVNDHLETSSKSSTSIEEKQICDVENKTQSKENSNQNMSQPISVSNAVANQKEVNNCDIIVVDNSNLDLSSFIVIDEVNSTTICEERVQLISDSEDICNDEVENNLVLANCSTKVNHSDVREDVVAVGSDKRPIYMEQFDYSRFSVEEIHRNQTDDSDAWQISYKDRAIWMNIDRPKKARCNKCRQFGHIALHCTEKWEPPKCSLCGNPGHLEPRCKNKICTQCGNEGDYSTNYCWKCFRFRHSICRICKMKGHLAKTCPDLWRRYHLTTEEGPIVVPQVSQQQPSHKQWCSGCAKQGHLEHECTYYNRVYPPSNPYIMSYEDVLYDGSRRLPQEYISNQNVTPSSSSYGLTMPPTPKPPSFSQQERIIISTGLNCIVEVNSSKPSKILNEMRLNYLKESPQDVGVLTQIKLKNALER